MVILCSQIASLTRNKFNIATQTGASHLIRWSNKNLLVTAGTVMCGHALPAIYINPQHPTFQAFYTLTFKVLINPTQFLAYRKDHEKLTGKIFYRFLIGLLFAELQRAPNTRFFKKKGEQGLGTQNDQILLVMNNIVCIIIAERNNTIQLKNFQTQISMDASLLPSAQLRSRFPAPSPPPSERQ